jgi:hypothetical protein
VTDAEITLLRSLAETDVVTFMREDNTAAAVARFEATLARQHAGALPILEQSVAPAGALRRAAGPTGRPPR